MIIDMFCHHVSPLIIERVRNARSSQENVVPYKYGSNDFQCPIENADPEIRLEAMDKYGVDIQALSLTTESLYGFGTEEAAEICRISNDANFAICRAYPDRFVNICAVSLLDVESGIDEFSRAINELDCRAVIVSTNQNGKGLDSPEYYPFYEKLVEHDLPLLLHPTFWKSYLLAEAVEDRWSLMMGFGWPFDSTVAVWRLAFGGVFDRFPSLKVVMHHMGGMFPYFAGRIGLGSPRLSERFPKPVSEYFQNVYGDSAVSAGPLETYKCGYAFFGPDRLVYGSDYPFGFEKGERLIRENMAGLKSLGIPDSDMEKILGGNAKKLLRIV